MRTAIRLEGEGAILSNVVVVGYECGMDISGSSDIHMSDIQFDDVETAVRGSNVRGLLAERVSHNLGVTPFVASTSAPKPLPTLDVSQRNSIAYMVRMAAHGYV